ncbi:MAG: transglycosylase SLT domain-containing protein, partial [Roseinatronobacter sp.]|nr:transglycosylase SLT domain-containing protein [Roseinatronobacter sp.]
VGGAFRAGPWTLNKAGKGRYLATQQEALAILDSALASGRRNIDIGCMQINWHWHGAQFATLAQMIDPVENTRYAARYLRDLHQRLGDWELAVMRYHSADGARGRAYMQRVRGQMGRPSPPASPPSASQLAMQAQDSRHAGQRNGLLARPGVALVALERAGPLQGRQGPNR